MTKDIQQEITRLNKYIPHCLAKDRYRLSRRLQKICKMHQKGKKVDQSLIDLMVQVEESQELREFRHSNVPKLSYPKELPILTRKQEILEAIQKNQVIIIAGETGSGKTTQLPKICLEAGCGREGKIGCTQPRRVAATSVASYIETQVEGKKKPVSYQIRFQNTDTPYSYIKLMTDGILLAEIQTDRFLYEYDTVIIDEAHERSLNIDFILGYLKKILARRPDFKVIVSSATLDTESFQNFLIMLLLSKYREGPIRLLCFTSL